MKMKKMIIITIIILSVFILRWQSWGVPLDRDEGAYAYIASHLFEKGFTPYKDAFDHKPPGIYLLYWGFFQVFGKTEFTIRTLGFVNAFLGSILFYLILRRLNAKLKLLLLTFIYIFVTNSLAFSGLQTNTEVFLSTFLLLFLLIFLKISDGKRRISQFYIFILGLIGALALLIKPNAVLNIGLVIFWIIFSKRKKSIPLIIYFSAGILIPLTLIIVYFWHSHALNQFIESVITFNKWYIGNGVVDTIPKLKYIFWLIRGPQMIGSWVTQITIIIALIILLIEIKNHNIKNFVQDKKKIFIILWMFSYLLAAKIPIRDYDHYYFPFLGSAVLFFALIPSKTLSKFLALIPLVLFLLTWGGLWLISPKNAYTKYYRLSEPVYFYRNIGLNIKEKTNNDDKIFLWMDEPQILFYSQRMSSSRFINTYGMMIPTFYDEMQKGLMEKPKIILIEKNIPDRLAKFINQSDYIKKTSNGMIDLYQRND